PLRTWDLHTIVLDESFEQANALVIQPVPAIVLGVLECSVPMFLPLLEENGSRIFFAEIGCQGVLEAATKNHRGSIFLFTPAVEISIAILPWTLQILANLGEAVGHSTLPPRHLREHPSR